MPGKPDWNAGLGPSPSAVNVANEYLDAAYLRDKARDHPSDYAERYLLGQWVTPKLEPCPFCGNPDVREHRRPCIECRRCGAEGPSGRTSEEAIELWNRRGNAAKTVSRGSHGVGAETREGDKA